MLNILYQFQGIVGAILGAATTLVITQILHNIGKLYFYTREYKLTAFKKYRDESKATIRKKTDDFQEASQVEFELHIQVYNSSENIKIMKDIIIEFVLSNQSIYFQPKRKTGKNKYEDEYKQCLFFNIPAKEIMEIEMIGDLSFDDYPQITNFTELKKVYLKYNTYKNMEEKYLIWKRS